MDRMAPSSYVLTAVLGSGLEDWINECGGSLVLRSDIVDLFINCRGTYLHNIFEWGVYTLFGSAIPGRVFVLERKWKKLSGSYLNRKYARNMPESRVDFPCLEAPI